MDTVSRILAAIAQLDGAELRQVRQEVDRLEKASRAIHLECEGVKYQLLRLPDGEFIDLLRSSLTIEEDLGFLMRFHLLLQETQQALNFAEVYAVLRDLTGESGRHFDPYKGAFSFPFALDVCKGGQSFPYLLEVHICRDSLYFPIRRIVGPDDPRLGEHRIHQPFAAEFSLEEMNELIAYFYGYLCGCWNIVREHCREPFLRSVSAGGLLFGFCNGRYFEEEHLSVEAYEAARQRYEEQVKQEKQHALEADPCLVRRAERDHRPLPEGIGDAPRLPH